MADHQPEHIDTMVKTACLAREIAGRERGKEHGERNPLASRQDAYPAVADD
jgi:hypothetical protein